MSFYEVIYETPGVDGVSAGEKWHRLPNLWGVKGERGLELWELSMAVLQAVSFKMGYAKWDCFLREVERA